MSNASPATDEAGAVGFVFARPDGVSFDHAQVCSPRGRVAGGLRSAAGQQGIKPGLVLGLNEQIRERSVRAVGRGGCQHDLRVGRHFNFARLIATVGDRHSARFRILLCRNQHLQARVQRAVATDDLDPILGKGSAVLIGPGAGRLKARRPHVTRIEIAQIYRLPCFIAGAVGLPASHREVAPTAKPCAGGIDHHGVATVAKQLRMWSSWAPGVQPTPPNAAEHGQTRLTDLKLGARWQIVD